MAVSNGNIPLVNRKSWQFMNPAPATTAAGSFVVTDRSGTTGNTLYINNSTTHYGYSALQDAWLQIPSMALAGTFGAGACGTYSAWSNTYTATGGNTTTIVTSSLINGIAVGSTVRFLSGTAANLGLERTITGVSNTGGVVTLTLSSAVTSSVANTDTFALTTGRFFIMNAGTVAAGIFKSFDIATGTVTSLGTTNLPASWGTDGRLVATPYNDGAFATGTATAGASTTLTNSAKTWTTNQWANYQVRITGGTGIGQVRTIASNTGTVLTVSASWTTIPDATSTYVIEGNDDYLYLLGNNAVTMYRYSISGNTWTVLSPGVARAAAPVVGMSANWVGVTGNSTWASENTILDGKYIYSFRGGSSALDRYDIAANSWSTVTYNYAQETFSTGSSYDILGGKIYIRKDATNRFFYFDIAGNNIFPFSTLLQTDGVALLGDKLWSHRYSSGGTNIDWIYSLANTGTNLYRVMVI